MAGEIKIKLFASVREKLGQDELVLPMEGPTTAGEILARIGKEYPEVSSTVKSSRLALDMAFAKPDSIIDPQQSVEIALIPPVSGG